MYKQVKTDSKITMSVSKSIVTPLKTLKDDFGGVVQIINDDNCYVICIKNKYEEYTPTTHIFKEVFDALLELPSPKLV